MRTISLFVFTILCLLLAVVPGTADTLYDNGPYNGTVDAWIIDSQFSVSDSFVPSTWLPVFLQGFNIVTWNGPGENLNSLEVQIGSRPFGNDYSDEILAPWSSADLGLNQYGYELWRYDFGWTRWPILNSGTSWITLSNASVTNDDFIYWDENSGIGCTSPGCPSTAYENTFGSIPSEAFTLTGLHWTGGTTPEPSSIMLFGSGVLGLADILRRRRSR